MEKNAHFLLILAWKSGYINSSMNALVWKLIAAATMSRKRIGFLLRTNAYAIIPKPIAIICRIPESIIGKIDMMQNRTIVSGASMHSRL